MSDPQMAVIEAAFDQRIKEKIAASDIPEAEHDIFMDLIGTVLEKLLSACFGKTPDALAKDMKNPSSMASRSLNRQLQRAAKADGRLADSRAAGSKASAVLREVADESSHEDLVAFIQYGRGEVIPDEFSML